MTQMTSETILAVELALNHWEGLMFDDLDKANEFLRKEENYEAYVFANGPIYIEKDEKGTYYTVFVRPRSGV